MNTPTTAVTAIEKVWEPLKAGFSFQIKRNGQFVAQYSTLAQAQAALEVK